MLTRWISKNKRRLYQGELDCGLEIESARSKLLRGAPSEEKTAEHIGSAVGCFLNNAANCLLLNTQTRYHLLLRKYAPIAVITAIRP